MSEEIQLTSGPYGHMLNSAQVFSPDDQWIVYDVRNDGAHISQTCCIEKVNVSSGEIKKLYAAPFQTAHGPGVGAAAYHPFEPKIIFIHGLLNCTQENPYGFTRRFGAILDEANVGQITHAEGRKISVPFIAGALRGGTHAHTWSGDGEWISFTYNDFIVEKLSARSGAGLKDLRTIGVMSPVNTVFVSDENAENFSGKYFSVVAATVTERPRPGSDDIEKAFDECWIGNRGYEKKDGTKQKRAIAFQGVVRTMGGSQITEIFVADIPEAMAEAPRVNPIEGIANSRPNVPRDFSQRRVTFTAGDKFPGIQGPRFWLRSSPDGATLYALMKDDEGIIQVFQVPTIGGIIRQVTRLSSGTQGQFNISPDGERLASIADNSIWLTDIKSGSSERITGRVTDDQAPVSGVLWNRAGNILVYNRYVNEGSRRNLQIFKVKVN